MRRETQNILLLLLGGALLKLAIGGEYLRYVKPVHQPWVLGGGAIMLLLGIIAIVRDVRSGGAEPESACARAEGAGAHAGHGHDEHAHSSRSAWLLVVPVLTVLLVAPPALGADSVTRAGAGARSKANAGAAAFPKLPGDTVLSMRITDFQARAGWDSAGSLNGRTVALTGFVAHDKGKVYLARMVIGCCAADGYPVTVRLVADGAREVARFADDDWVKVTGQLVPGSATEQTNYVPDLSVASVRAITAPADPYEY